MKWMEEANVKPKTTGLYLVSDGKTVTTAKYWGEMGINSNKDLVLWSYGGTIEEVLWWQPLPKPPVLKKDEGAT